MSGQPVKTQSDVNKFRNEYMETLALQESINDMNLQANKTYLLTGQLPPQSQMQDTRTNAEKLADIEKMKREIASNLREIAEPSFAYSIVNKVISSPLNLDNSLFRFLAQRASSISEQLKRILPYGIAGDENDLERIVDFIKNMYSEQQGKFQTTKSYMNSVSSSNVNSGVISGNDIDTIILGLQDIMKNIELLKQRTKDVGLTNDGSRLFRLLKHLKSSLLTTAEMKLLLQDLDSPEFNNPLNRDIFDKTDFEAFFRLIEKLPRYTEVMALINKINQYIRTGNNRLVSDGLNNLEKMFMSIDGIDNDTLIQRFSELKNRQIEKQQRAIREVQQPVRELPQGPRNIPLTVGSEEDVSNSDAYSQPSNKPIGIPTFAREARRARIKQIADRLNPVELRNLIDFVALNDEHVVDKETAIDSLAHDDTYNLGDIGIGGPRGLGLKKKRRGRPRGSGIAKVIPPKIPNFIGFGINEINQKQLKNGIVKIRRNTKTNYVDMPSRRVSSNLTNILNTIIGGGIPKYEELGKLDNEEKNYLHKLIGKSNLEDRLSVPAPSKDQQEKDIHNFEIMKGQIMSGNDNAEMVKKFKLLIRKLSKQGLLPDRDVDDIIETLTDIGY